MENEEKQSWIKKHLKKCIIALVAIIAIVAVVVVILVNKKPSPEDVMKSYVTVMSSGDVDGMMNIMDLKGAYAWEQCNGDSEKFAEEYSNAADDVVSSYESEIKNTLQSGMEMLHTFGDIEMAINSMDAPEKLSNDIYKVKANVKIKAKILGTENEQDQDMAIVTYNGKYIGTYSE